MFELTGHAALVTGAGQNVGAGIARALAAQGALVAVNDVRADRAEEVAAQIRKSGHSAVAAPFDVTDLDAVTAGVADAKAALGQPIDIVVNNAGVPEGMTTEPFRTLDPSRWRMPVELNVFGSISCVKAVIDDMCDLGWGRVVQISSGAGRTGLAMGVAMYGTGKSGIEGFIRHLAKEVAGTGVTANTLALGVMHTSGADPRSVPVGRLGKPEDAAAAVVFLASPEAAWLTGQTIDLNGGSVTH